MGQDVKGPKKTKTHVDKDPKRGKKSKRAGGFCKLSSLQENTMLKARGGRKSEPHAVKRKKRNHI